jgi:hypothetical protein
MPGETTPYRRLQVILELSASKKPDGKDKFISSIEKKSPPNFAYNRWDSEKEERREVCSIRAIQKTFSLAADLEFLNPSTGKLSAIGEKAGDPSRFERIVVEQVGNLFEKWELSIDRLMEESQKLLRGKTIVLPTAEALYVKLFEGQIPPIPFSKFRTLVRLLADCGGINMSRRQIFLPIKY